MILALVLWRLCEPSSELSIAEHLYERSPLADLLGIEEVKINDGRLYRALDNLLPHKNALEKHLKERLGELFNLEYDLLLYDVTSTYVEGRAEDNGQAQRGYSRCHRIVNRYVLPWWYHGKGCRWAMRYLMATGMM
jgi:hypothetical protein